MVRKISMTTDIPANREMHITLPSDVPSGPADVVVLVTPHSLNPLPTFGDLAESEFFGMWRDREDISDSADFARRLRGLH